MPEPDPIQHPHDALFRAALGEPSRAAELLRSTLPASLVEAIDWTSLQRIDKSFVDDALRNGQADLLFVAEIGKRQALLYLLLEHKSGSDRFCAFQMLRYATRVWEQFRRENPEATHLPPILPFVLHHGPTQGDRHRATPWTSPQNLRELIDLEGLPSPLVELQPEFAFVLDDLSAPAHGTLQARELGAATLLPLLHLQEIRGSKHTAALIAAWAHLYRKLLTQAGCQDLLSQLFFYVATVGNDAPDDIRTAYASISRPIEERYMSTLDQMIQEGRLAGRQEGRQEGQAQTLLTLMEQRFGELPGAIVHKVQSASAEQLDLWTRRVLTAESAEGVVR